MAPPNRAQISPNEGNILPVMSVFQSGQCASILAAARIYNVSKATLTRRINRGTTREDYTPTNKKLTNIEEEVLVRDILKLDAQGLSPTISLMREMADTICRAKGIPRVRVKWANNFVKRTLAFVKLGPSRSRSLHLILGRR
jgi:DNA invertase Pin-like site-specific DNA recombinase